jgi:hypothetical protein
VAGIIESVWGLHPSKEIVKINSNKLLESLFIRPLFNLIAHRNEKHIKTIDTADSLYNYPVYEATIGSLGIAVKMSNYGRS